MSSPLSSSVPSAPLPDVSPAPDPLLAPPPLPVLCDELALDQLGEGLPVRDQDWDTLLAAFPLNLPTRTSPIARPRSATISASIMREAALRAAPVRDALDDEEAALAVNEPSNQLDNAEQMAPHVFPTIRPSLITPPRAPAPPVVDAATASAVLVAPRPSHVTPTVAHLEDTVAAGPTVSTARKGKKRARIDSTSPSPAAAPRTRPAPTEATPSQRPRRAPLLNLTTLAPSNWVTPAAPRGRLAPVAVALIEANIPPHPDASRLTPTVHARGQAMAHASTTRPPPAASSSRRRANDENAAPERGVFNMDIDLELDHSLAVRRPLPPYGMPLQSLDLNRVRFPDAYQHMGPLPEEETGNQSDDDLWAQIDGDEHRPRGLLSVRDRPPTPHPAQGLQAPQPTPARVVSHSAAALAASFTPSQPIPIPAIQPAPQGPTVGTATYLAATNAGLAGSIGSFQFTSAPPGGFPEVYLADPDGLFTGLTPARGVALREERACFIVRVHNLTNMNHFDVRQAVILITSIVRHVTGELNPLVVPPQPAPPVTPNAPRPNPLSFAVLGITVESVLRMLRMSTWSTVMGTIHVSRPVIGVSRFMFVAAGFAHDHNGSILNAVFAVFSGPIVLPTIIQLVQSHPELRDTPSDEAARAILASLEVRVATLQNGSIQAAVYCDPPTLTPSRWTEWRAGVAQVPITHPLNSTGYARRSAPCAGCHGEDHPTHLCPFQDIPGWNAPAPGTTWAQPGQGPPAPPPPPPPAGNSSASRGRSHSARRGTNSATFNAHRRDYRGGGDGRAGGSGAGSSRGNGSSGFGGAAGAAAF